MRESSRKSRRARNAALVFAAATLITVLLSTSLALDVGYASALAAEAQNTADAACLAGAIALREGRPDDIMRRIQDSLGSGRIKEGFLALDERVVEVGKWDSRFHKFHPLPAEEWEGSAFAVRVRAVRNNAPRLLSMIGGNDSDIWRESIAVGSRPCHGLWGLEGILIHGALQMDGYFSQDGSYSRENALAEGDLCSGRGIAVNGTVEVKGDVMSGYGYPITLQGRPVIDGLTSDRVGAVPAPSTGLDELQRSNDNHRLPLTNQGTVALRSGDALVLGPNETLEVPPGRYSLSSLSLDPLSTIRFTGPTVLHVRGNLEAAGARLINSNNEPRSLRIVCLGGSLKMGGEFDTYASVVAPKADVRVQGPGDWYGALLGRYVTVVGKVSFHVDESLQNPLSPPAPFWVK